ncbi:MAG: peptidylprolyl isomerase [Candidatus Bipolaricaulota bacterium]
MSTFFKRHQRFVIWAVVVSFVVGGVGLFSLDRSGLFSGSGGTEDGRPAYAASVDGDRISLEALSARASQLLNQYRSLLAQIGQDTSTLLAGTPGAMLTLRLQGGATSDLIRETIYAQEAKKRGIKVADATIEAAVAAEYQAFLTSNNITEETLIAYLEANGSSLDRYKASIREAVAVQKLIDAVNAEVGTVALPTEEELLAFYEKNIVRYDESEQVRASHILVADEAEADALKEQLASGADFAELARAVSLDEGSKASGGELGWFERGQMVAEFEEAAFAATPGEIVGPVETTYGYHLILVAERKEARTPTLSDVRQTVLADWQEEAKAARIETWYEGVSALRDVEILLPEINAFLLQEEDLDRGLAEFERLKREGASSDPYLAYYIGQIYESKATTLETERAALEAQAEPTAEDTARIAELTAAEMDAKGRALAAYLSMADSSVADEALFYRILNLDSGNDVATLQLGRVLAERGDSAGAQARFAEVLAGNPESRDALLASGDLAQKDGKPSLARERFEKALLLQPRDIGTIVKLISVLLTLGDLEGAEARLAELRGVDPQGARLVIAEGDVLLARLRGADAARDLLAAKANRSAAEDAELASLESEIGSLYPTVVDKLEAGLQAGGGIDLNVKLADAHVLGGEFDEAEKEYGRVLARSPYRADAYEGLAQVHIERGETAEALDALRTALARSFAADQRIRVAKKIVSLDSADTSTRTRLAKLYVEQSRWTEAIGEYEQLIAADATIEEAYAGIAEAYAAEKDYNAALEYLLRGVENMQRDTAKMRLLEQIVTTDQAAVGLGNPYSSAGLDALIRIAQLELARGNREQARVKLEQVRNTDMLYRAEEVGPLLIQAAGATPE